MATDTENKKTWTCEGCKEDITDTEGLSYLSLCDVSTKGEHVEQHRFHNYDCLKNAFEDYETEGD